MNIYSIILYIVFVCVIIVRIRGGLKKGFVSELYNAFSILIALFLGFILKKGVEELVASKYGEVLALLALLSLVLFIYKMADIVLHSLKIFAKLPIIKGLDKVLGIIIGILEAVAINYAIVFILKLLIA